MQALTGRSNHVAQRNRPQDLPTHIPFVACDVLDAASVRHASRGVQQIVIAIGFAYERATWRAQWPKAMVHILAAAEHENVRVVFVDNLYMYDRKANLYMKIWPCKILVRSPRCALQSPGNGLRRIKRVGLKLQLYLRLIFMALVSRNRIWAMSLSAIS